MQALRASGMKIVGKTALLGEKKKLHSVCCEQPHSQWPEAVGHNSEVCIVAGELQKINPRLPGQLFGGKSISLLLPKASEFKVKK